MLEHRREVSLKAFNTFGIESWAAHFVEVRDKGQLLNALALGIRPVFILGGGSNVLLHERVPGLVIRNAILGVEVHHHLDGEVLISAGAGENWHALVQWTIERGFGGLENLSLIPGTVGAAPIQNIGAYGVELRDVFHQLEAVDLNTLETVMIHAAECGFGYRQSHFKGKWKGRYCITRVWFRLQSGFHDLQLEYGAIRETLGEMGVRTPTIADVARAVMAIRRSKLPDPAELGNAGSFFKNPELTALEFKRLLADFPDAKGFPMEKGGYKVPAGWLIERAGWKGKRFGRTGTHDRQSLVLVNYGNATGKEILEHARRIQHSVKEQFGIKLELEVNLVGKWNE